MTTYQTTGYEVVRGERVVSRWSDKADAILEAAYLTTETGRVHNVDAVYRVIGD
jgi:hypothetical protein